MPNPMPIARSIAVGEQVVTFATSLASSTPISFSQYSAFAFTTPAGAAATIISWYAASEINGTYTPVVLSNGNAAVTSAASSTTYISPPELFPLCYVKGVSSNGNVVCAVAMKG